MENVYFYFAKFFIFNENTNKRIIFILFINFIYNKKYIFCFIKTILLENIQ